MQTLLRLYPRHTLRKLGPWQIITNMVFSALHHLRVLETVRYPFFLNSSCCNAQASIVPGHTILPSIIDGLKSINDSSNPIKLILQAISYKPFISLFNLTGVVSANPELAGIGIFFLISHAEVIDNHS